MTSFLANFWCQSIAFTPDAGEPDLQTIRVGPWSAAVKVTNSIQNIGGTQYFVEENSCAAFPSGTVEADAKLRTVRAFGIIASVLGGLLLFFLYLSSCLYLVEEGSWRSVAIFISVFLTLFQGLTFLIFDSAFCTDNSILTAYNLTNSYSEECTWEQGSTANVIAVVFWFLTGLAMIYNGAPKRPERAPAEMQTVTYQRTELPEGGSTVAEVNVVKGTYVPNPPNEQFVEEKA